MYFTAENRAKKDRQYRYGEIIERYAEKYSIEEPLVYSVIRCESNFEEKAISRVGACGLMQIMPSTFEWLKTKAEFTSDDIFDPETNIEAGCFYLAYLFGKFEEKETALAAYNAGEGTVSEWLKDDRYSADGIKLKYIPYPETKYYVYNVTKAMKTYGGK